MQLNLDKKLYFIAFNNCKLTRAKLNFSIQEKTISY
jgi:hypothetical protein